MLQTWPTALGGRWQNAITRRNWPKYSTSANRPLAQSHPPRLALADDQTYRQRCEKSAAKTTENSTLTATALDNLNISRSVAALC